MNLPTKLKKLINKQSGVLMAVFLLIIIVIASLFVLENTKTKNRLMEIRAQEKKELSIIFERERIEQEKIDEDAYQRDIEDSNKSTQAYLRNICIEAADDAYFYYAELNGNKDEDGIITANSSVWEQARQNKQDDIDLCFKKYPVN